MDQEPVGYFLADNAAQHAFQVIFAVEGPADEEPGVRGTRRCPAGLVERRRLFVAEC